MKSKNTFIKSRNTLIFQTNYHTSRLILLIWDRKSHVELPPKKIENPRKSCRTGCDGIAAEPKNRPSGAGIDPKRRILTTITAHNSRICGQPGHWYELPQKNAQIIDGSL